MAAEVLSEEENKKIIESVALEVKESMDSGSKHRGLQLRCPLIIYIQVL